MPDSKALGVPDAAVEKLALALIGCGWVDASAYDSARREHGRSPRAEEMDAAKASIDADLGEALEAAYPEIHRAVVADLEKRLLEHDAKADGALAMNRAYLDAASDFEQYEAAIQAAFAALTEQADNQGEAG